MFFHIYHFSSLSFALFFPFLYIFTGAYLVFHRLMVDLWTLFSCDFISIWSNLYQFHCSSLILISTSRGQYPGIFIHDLLISLDSDIFRDLSLYLLRYSSPIFVHDPESTSCAESRLSMFVRIWSRINLISELSCIHMVASFFDHMCSQIDHTLVKEG